MSRHHRYSKRSRESRKALIGATDARSRRADPQVDPYDDLVDLSVPDENLHGFVSR